MFTLNTSCAIAQNVNRNEGSRKEHLLEERVTTINSRHSSQFFQSPTNNFQITSHPNRIPQKTYRITTEIMSTTVHVAGISSQTSEKEVRDFFSFCGKITSLSVTPSSDASDASKSAAVTFEKETAAKTALLLDNTQLGSSQVHVTTASGIDDIAAKAGQGTNAESEDISQEDKPRSRIVAEYLAHGYVLGDNVLQKAIQLDNQHGYSNRFTLALANFDSKYKATDRAKSVDQSYGVTNKAQGAWNGLNSYFEKALSTPTGQKVRDFYVQGDRQVRDIHNEARRLADLKAGKTMNAPETVAGTDKTVCQCGGTEGTCGCAPGTCACSNCAKSTDAAVSEVKEAQQAASEKF